LAHHTEIPIRVDAFLRLDDRLLDDRTRRLLESALDVRNPDDPMQFVPMLRRDTDGLLTIPRGFAYKLAKGLEQCGYKAVWDDRRVEAPIDLNVEISDEYRPRDYQAVAIERMLACEQGIYEAPPGAGKTITAAHFIARASQRTLVIVDRINIATQWIERLRSVLGDWMTVGLIGEGSWSEGDITVALRQALWRRKDDLDARNWWCQFGAVILDECHAVSAETVRELFQRFPAKYRIGLSATPDRFMWMTIASRGIIGEIICRTTDNMLEKAGVLVRPQVIAVRTPFEFPWKANARDKRRQWQKMIKELKVHGGRNTVIAKIMASCRGHTCLAHTDQKSHAHELAAWAMAHGWPRDRVMMMTGDESGAERAKIVEAANDGDILIISTVGQEALDIPRLDRFFLVWPTRQPLPVRQMVGRVKRVHSEKAPPIVYDFYDDKVTVLRDQFAVRRGTYERDHLDLRIIG